MNDEYVQWPEGASDALGTGIINNCKMPCGSWESNPGLQEQPVFLTSELSLQTLVWLDLVLRQSHYVALRLS